MEQISPELARYGLLVVFVNVLLAEGGLPVPALPILVVAGALTTGGADQLVMLMAAGAVGCLVADLAWYWCGKHYGGRVLGWLCKLSLSPDHCVHQTETMFSKVGKSSLLFAKFLPGLSTVSVAMAGISRMTPAVFLLLDAAGALLFVSVAILLGWAFRDSIDDTLKAIAATGRFGARLVLLLLCVYLLARWWRRRAFIRQLRMDRISVAELRRSIDEGRKPLILDVRPKEIRLREGTIPGAVPASPEDLDSIVLAARSSHEVVVYCACPNEASAAVVAKRLKQAGIKRVHPLLGGIDAWIAAGQPLERSPPLAATPAIDEHAT
jgi:membrane protein DedA with SNARE-associated domain/rhodanese-related sulfurtransferase